MRLLTALLFCACWPAAPALGADGSASKGGAAYLDFNLGARAAGMGRAQAAVPTEDVTSMHANNALLALQHGRTASFSTGNIGLGRNIYFAGYAHPLSLRQEQWCAKDMLDDNLTPEERAAVFSASGESPPPSDPGCTDAGAVEDAAAPGTRHWEETLVKTRRLDMAFGAGITQFGIGGLTGRSEFGALEAAFEDTERAIYFDYAMRPYENLTVGIGGKYLTQKLQAATAKGASFDAGIWYGVPRISRGELSLALVGRDLGGSLKWEVPDPELGAKFSYREPVPVKLLFGAAYKTSGGHWLLAADVRKDAGRKTRLYAGLELRALSAFSLRAGTSDNNPTAGFSWTPGGKRIALRFDYSYEYDLQSLYSPQWLTLTVRFLPPPAVAVQPAQKS